MKAIFSDVGGFLLTNGWDHALRQRIAKQFNLNFDELQLRHEQVFDLFERGKIDFDAYLQKTLFYEKRPFALESFKRAIFEAARPYPEAIAFLQQLKKRWGCPVVVTSNEGRDLALDRVRRFELAKTVDFFIFSCFIEARKPEALFYQKAIDLVQCEPHEILYIDDREDMVLAGRNYGMQAFHYKDVASLSQAVDAFLLERVR